MSHRPYRPTMRRQHGRGAAHKRLNLPGPVFTDTPAGKESPSAKAERRWFGRHGRKKTMLYCHALKLVKTLVPFDPDADHLDVYPCWMGDEPASHKLHPLHWHVGHRV